VRGSRALARSDHPVAPSPIVEGTSCVSKTKVGIVTDAAAGIGEATARLFANEGARVVVADSNGEGAKAVADQIGEAAIECDSRRFELKRMS
jgi:NADP-dependent 3-hydroxy acid dehydrogenase YdfG